MFLNRKEFLWRATCFLFLFSSHTTFFSTCFVSTDLSSSPCYFRPSSHSIIRFEYSLFLFIIIIAFGQFGTSSRKVFLS
jgi:hypothetical protein